MEVPRLGVKWKLKLPAYTTAIAMQDPSCVCNLHHSSWHYRIPNPLSKARDRTCVLMDTSWIHFLCVRTGTPKLYISTSTISILSRPYFIYFWFLLFLGFFIVEIFFFSFPFFTTPKAYGSSWVREWIWATSPTYTTAVATPNSYHIVPQEELIFLLLLRNLISKKLFLFYLGI